MLTFWLFIKNYSQSHFNFPKFLVLESKKLVFVVAIVLNEIHIIRNQIFNAIKPSAVEFVMIEIFFESEVLNLWKNLRDFCWISAFFLKIFILDMLVQLALIFS